MPKAGFPDNLETLKMNIRKHFIYFIAIFALAASCTGIPGAESFVAPQIVETLSKVKGDTVELTCVYSSKVGYSQYGFSYGAKNDDIKDVLCDDVQPNAFKVEITGLPYNTTFTYSAFISNGSRRYKSFDAEFSTGPDPADTVIIDDFFEDKALLSYVLNQADKNEDGCLSVGEARSVKSLCLDYDVESLAGLEYLENLTTLSCISCDIPTDLDLSFLTRLENLEVTWCNLKSVQLPVSLKYLDVSHNKLKSLDLTSFPSLETVICSQNTYLNSLLTLKGIKRLECTDTALKTLDLTGYSSLEALVFASSSNGVLQDIILNGCTSLTELKIDTGRMKTVDLSDSPNLKKVAIYSGIYYDLASFNLSMVKNVQDFTLQDCPETNLDFSSNCKKLKSVTVDRTGVTELDFTGCPDLSSITLRENSSLKSVKLIAGHDYEVQVYPKVEVTYE